MNNYIIKLIGFLIILAFLSCVIFIAGFILSGFWHPVYWWLVGGIVAATLWIGSIIISILIGFEK